MAGFLTARWRHLVIATYQVDPDALRPILPSGVMLDLWEHRPLVSLLGLEMTDVRVRGVAIPMYRRFPEVNARCYARCRRDGKPGVVFLKEIVPRRAVALVARLVFNEHFVARPLRHTAKRRGAETILRYEWRDEGRTHALEAAIAGAPSPLARGSLEEFIMERRRGFAARRDGALLTYAIDREPWRWWRPQTSDVAVDGAQLCGPAFRGVFDKPPFSIVVAEGSPITVRRTAE